MDNKNNPQKLQETPVPENLDRQTPISRGDSLPPFPISNPAQPNQGQTLSDLPQPQQGQQDQTLVQGSSTQPNQEKETNLNIKQPDFGKKGSSLLKILAAFLIIAFLVAFSASLALAYTNYKFITPPKIVQRAIDRLILFTPLPKPQD